MVYCGIDFHSNSSVVAVIDDADRVIAQKRLPNELPKILGFVARWKNDLAGVARSTPVQTARNGYFDLGADLAVPTGTTMVAQGQAVLPNGRLIADLATGLTRIESQHAP